MPTMIEVPLILVFFVGVGALILILNLIKINKTLDKIVKEKFNIKSNSESLNDKPDKIIPKTLQEGDFITAPMVGIIYLSPEPTKPQFVNVGDHIKQGDTVAIIEAMKTYSNIRASKSGIIKEILAKNGTPVEYGEKIICIE